MAYAFIACPKWEPIRGMRGVVVDGPDFAKNMILHYGENGWADGDGDAIYDRCVVLPDLADALTCAGLLLVVRNALYDPHVGIVGSRLGLWFVLFPTDGDATHPAGADLRAMAASPEAALLKILQEAK